MPEIQPNEELRAFMRRLYANFSERDFDSLREMFSSQAYAVMIGTDPDEFWLGPDGIKITLQQTSELQSLTLTSEEMWCYSSGNVGWTADKVLISADGGEPFPARVTCVLAIERGHWRVVQWHCSIGEQDTIKFGRELTKSIDRLEASVQEDRPDVSPASAPDGTVTIAFTDIESSTVLLDRLGDVEFQRMLAWHDDIVRSCTTEQRGYIVKSQGDGFMLAFPSAAYALRACLMIRDRIAEGFGGPPIRVRAGLHSGEAIKRDDDFFGRTVVIAARISGLAVGGEVLASDLVHGLARGLGTFEFGEPRDTVLKGIEGSYRVFPVLS